MGAESVNGVRLPPVLLKMSKPLLLSDKARRMLSNTEFIIMLKQAKVLI